MLAKRHKTYFKKIILRDCFCLHNQIDASYLSFIILPIKKKRHNIQQRSTEQPLTPWWTFTWLFRLLFVLSSLLKKLETLTLYQMIGPFGLFISTITICTLLNILKYILESLSLQNIIDRFVTGVPALVADTKVTVKACILFIIIINVKRKKTQFTCH